MLLQSWRSPPAAAPQPRRSHMGPTGVCDAALSASGHLRPNPAAADSRRALFNQGRFQKRPPPPATASSALIQQRPTSAAHPSAPPPRAAASSDKPSRFVREGLVVVG
jgi:hypothetical protein